MAMAMLIVLATLLFPCLKQAQIRTKYGRWMIRDKSLPADENLPAYYNFQEKEGSSLKNQSMGNIHDSKSKPETLNGTLNGTTWGNGRWKGKGGLQFSGASSYVAIGGNILQNTNELSMEVWARPLADSWTSYATIFSCGPAGCASISCSTWSGKPAFSFSFYDTPTSAVGLLAKNGVIEGGWNHVVATWQKENHLMKIYINGVLSNTCSTGTREMYNFGSRQSGIGAYQDASGIWRKFFIGQIDEVVLYDRVLTDKEIKERFDMGNAM